MILVSLCYTSFFTIFVEIQKVEKYIVLQIHLHNKSIQEHYDIVLISFYFLITNNRELAFFTACQIGTQHFTSTTTMTSKCLSWSFITNSEAITVYVKWGIFARFWPLSAYIEPYLLCYQWSLKRSFWKSSQSTILNYLVSSANLTI